jgi:hypothetical protein
MTLKSLIAGAALAVAAVVAVAPQAEAAFVGPVVVSGPSASSSFGSPLNVGDVGFVVGSIQGDNVDFTHTFTFETLSDSLAHAAAVSIDIPSLIGIENLGVSLNGSAVDMGVLTAKLMAGMHEVVVTGTTNGLFGGNYKADIALSEVPIPGAALLFGSAVAGIGYMRRRRAA